MAKIYKLIVNVPFSHADAVRKSIGDAGAGNVGNYSHCSFSVRGTGRFMPMEGATPHIGTIGSPEAVEEEQIQVDVTADRLEDVLKALWASHPYEEIGYDLYEKVSPPLPLDR